MTPRRRTSRDGLANRLNLYVGTHFGAVWRGIDKIGPVRRLINRRLINVAIAGLPPRPGPISALAPYTTWESLTDRTFFARHLPPVPGQDAGRPSVDAAAHWFLRRDGMIPCPKSTLLFADFAQWFTDGFLRGDRNTPPDLRRTASHHEIDLSQLYGPRPEVTRLLRTFSGGLLKSQILNGEEYPLFLCENGEIKPEFRGLSVIGFDGLTVEQRNGLLAMGADRANFQTGYTMLNVLFFREHNRIARLLTAEYPGWDDGRLFATARNILTVMLIKIVIDEYINHITPYHFRFSFDPSAFPNEPWYRQNWSAIEFNLLYRWHGLVPSTVRIDGAELPLADTLFNPGLLTKRGLGPLFEDASNQPAGRIGLFNTDPGLLETELLSIRQGRLLELASYNDYRQAAGLPRLTDVNQLSGDPEIQRVLRTHYASVDRIEYYVGIFAEDQLPNSVVPNLISRLVGTDAFSQALTNPLLAPRVFNEATFSPLGMELIRDTERLGDLLHRNVPAGSPHYFVSMTRRDWRRQ